MKWITRRHLHVDRTACPWLIRKFIDPEAEFVFVDPDTDPATLDGHTFDLRGAEFGHVGKRCTFETLLRHFDLRDDRALRIMGYIIRAADVLPSRNRRSEGAGLDALMRGIQLSVPDDYEKLRLTGPIYDAVYAYCQAQAAEVPVNPGAPRPQFKHTRRGPVVDLDQLDRGERAG